MLLTWGLRRLNFTHGATRGVICGLALLSVPLVGVQGARASQRLERLIEAMRSQEVISSDQADALRASLDPEDEEKAYNVRWKAKLQIQAAKSDVESTHSSGSYSTLELRRLRWGFTAELKNNFEAELEAHLAPSGNRLKKGILSWTPSEVFSLRAGFQKPLSSLDEDISTAKMTTVERSHISNTLAGPGESTGVLMEGEAGPFLYGAGVFTDQAHTNTTSQRAYNLHNLRVGVRWDEIVGKESSLKAHASLLHSDDRNGLLGADFEQSRVLGLEYRQRGFRLQAELLRGFLGDLETSGGYVTSSYRWGKLEPVVRLEKADSTMALSLPSRYSSHVDILAPADQGDQFRSSYLGLNYLIDGEDHRILMALEKAELRNTPKGLLNATTLFLAWRVAL